MGLLEMIIVIAVIAVVVWAITTYLPMDARFKTLIVVIALVVCCLFVLRATGILDFDIPVRQRP